MKILLTGGAGFIGSNLVRWMLEHTKYSVVVLDALTYAGNLENLQACLDNQRCTFVHGNIVDRELVNSLMEQHSFEGVFHLAAESHVDRSIQSAQPFVETNVLGTLILLECALKNNVRRFLHVSTDEVYGELGPTDFPFIESHPLRPSSPYAASKAGSDHIVQSFVRTHGMDCIITRCSNNYGAYQFPEKFIPLMVVNALEKRGMPVYGDGLQSRDWIHVNDHCRGLVAAFKNGIAGHTYNLGGDAERTNIDVAQSIARLTNAGEQLITHVQDRPGHDRRYAIDFSKAKRELAWEPLINFENGLAETIEWYTSNTDWCNHVRSGEYRTYYQRQYQTEL